MKVGSPFENTALFLGQGELASPMSSREVTQLLIFGVAILVLALFANHFGWL